MNFGSVTVGTQSAAQTLTLTNSSTSSITGLHVAIGTPYKLTQNQCTQTIAANGTCTMGIAFAPQLAGSRSGSVTLTDSAANSPQVIAVSGTGVMASPTATATATPTPSGM
jgi:hypothetical protein